MISYKLIVHTPRSHTETILKALGEAGAGKIGNYDFCSFTYQGLGRFRGNEKSNPAIGEKGVVVVVEEDVIEVRVAERDLAKIVGKLKEVHPYEEPAYEVIKLENF